MSSCRLPPACLSIDSRRPPPPSRQDVRLQHASCRPLRPLSSYHLPPAHHAATSPPPRRCVLLLPPPALFEPSTAGSCMPSARGHHHHHCQHNILLANERRRPSSRRKPRRLPQTWRLFWREERCWDRPPPDGAAAAPPPQAIPARAAGRGGRESHLRESDRSPLRGTSLLENEGQTGSCLWDQRARRRTDEFGSP